MNKPRHSSCVQALSLKRLGLLILLVAPILLQAGTITVEPRTMKGAVYARTIVPGENDQPVFVEFNRYTGSEVRKIGEAVNDLANAIIMGASTYSSFATQNQTLISSYPGAELVSRSDYETQAYETSSGEDIQKKSLPASTLTLLLLPASQRLTIEAEDLILAEYPVDLVNYPDVKPGAVSLLIAVDGKIVESSSNNIGYRTGFFDDIHTEQAEITPRDRPQDAKIHAPISRVKIEIVSAGVQEGRTGRNGLYSIKYPWVLCPGLVPIPGSSTVYAELFYNNFNPKRSKPATPYYMVQRPLDGCYNYLAYLVGYQPNPEEFTTADFWVDVMVLAGKGELADENGEQIPVIPKIGGGECGPTDYKNTPTEYFAEAADTTPIKNNFDFDGDGIIDPAVLGREDAEGSFIKVDDPIEATIQGIYLSSSTSDHTSDDTELNQPDIRRLPDEALDTRHQGLVKRIFECDLADTDVFVFRESTGDLIVHREGMKFSELIGANSSTSEFFYQIIMRGPTEGIGLGDNFGDFELWKAAGQMKPELHKRKADHLRPGELVRIIAINRATGYMGSITLPLQSAAAENGGPPNSVQEISFPIDSLIMKPPNLKVTVERAFKVEAGLSKGESRKYLVGFEGAGLTSDKVISVTTEWLDHDGRPLPRGLWGYGYTGRLAKVNDDKELQVIEGSQLAHFRIEPGSRKQLVRLREKAAIKEHFYIHVDGSPESENPDFSARVVSEGILTHRPDKFVPFKVPVFDEIATEVLNIQARANGLEKPLPTYIDVYRPEMQFSVFDLINPKVEYKDEDENIQLINLTTAAAEEVDEALKSIDLVTILYDLEGTRLDPLRPFGPERKLALAVGEEEKRIAVADDGSATFVNLDHLALLEPEDFMAISLYQNSDAANILWEFAYSVSDVFALAVDLNRNGRVEFTLPEDGSLSDKTTATLPYRFWVNDDYDVVQNMSSITSQTHCEGPPEEPDSINEQQSQVCEQWDITEGSVTNTYPHGQLARIETRRDLEDFAPLAIKLPKPYIKSGNFYLKFTAQGMRINLFKGIWRDDGIYKAHAYVYDKTVNELQIEAANDTNGYLFEVNSTEAGYIPASDLRQYFDAQGIGRFIFEGTVESDEICETNAANCYLLVEVMQGGADHTSIAEQRIFLDLHTVTDLYQNLTAGEGADGGDPEGPGIVSPITGDAEFLHIYDGVFPETELAQDYTLLVHGWRMTDLEKIGFANTGFKRFYWSGYKGSFGALSWPTGWIEKPAHEYDKLTIGSYLLGNEQNYGASEAVAREVGTELAVWLANLTGYEDKHVVAHSMGNVVVSEALRQYQPDGLITSYTASQAATVGGAYDQNMPSIRHKVSFLSTCPLAAVGVPVRAEVAWRCYNAENTPETLFDMHHQ